MYPNHKSPSYGVFVSNFAQSFQGGGNQIVLKSLIKGRKKGIGKIFKYIWFFMDVFWKSNFGSYELIYVHYMQHSLLPLKFWWKRGTRKLVLNAHGTDIMGSGRIADFLRKFNKATVLQADLVVVPSSFFVPKLRQMDVNKEKIFVSPSGGIDPKNFYVGVRNELNMKIGYLGRLDPGKGLNTLLDSFKNISNELNLELEIIGSGSLSSELRLKTQNYNLNHQVKFLGVLTQKEIGEKLRKWDLLIFPSELQESLGLVGLEAMACGIPVIGSRQGGIITYLENKENGYTFDPGNVNELSSAILKFYSLKKPDRKQMSDMALQTAEQYLKPRVFSRLNDQLNNLFND